MELKIDNRICDTGRAECPVWSWEAEALRSPQMLREGWSVELTLPSSRTNDAVFLHAASPHGAERFNRALHSAELSVDGAVLFRGVARLLESRPGSLGERYRIELRGGAAGWAKRAAELPLHALEIPLDLRLIPTDICRTWEEGTDGEPVVRMLPVVYDDYRPTYSSESLMPAERILSVDDYHPFLQLRALAEAIFRQAGYTLESRFMEGEFFRSLYMSGAYASRDTEALKRRMDFRAGRTGDADAEANFSGRVYASPFMVSNSVGNIVDAFTPQSDGGAGDSEALYTTGGCLRMEQGELLFRPPVTVEVGFEYRIRYRTDYRILSRTRLTGFDSVYLGAGADMSFRLTNRFQDRRPRLTGGQSYRAVVFDHEEGNRYRLQIPGGEPFAEFAARSALVTVPAAGGGGQAQLLCMGADETAWHLCGGDWALYDGHVGETGTTEVELNVRTAPETAGPAQPKNFRTIYFYGAEPGMNFRLLKSTTVQPYFSSRPGFGARLAFTDVARHGIRQIELLEALGHLFDLRFFTDEEQKRVVVEPAADFYSCGTVTDWSGRICADGETVLAESDSGEHEARLYGYREGDGAVRRFEQASGQAFGDWTVRSVSMAAKRGVEELRNPLFAPTLDEAGHSACAPSALIPMVGDRDDTETVDAYAFTPRIVRYAGYRALPGGERWGYPCREGFYPFAAFHFAGDGTTEGFTLCFEDRDGLTGLHRFYDEDEALRRRGQTLIADLSLTAPEVQRLGMLGEEGLPGLNSLFRLKIGGEPVRCRLAAVERYDASKGVARCRFTLLNDDRP